MKTRKRTFKNLLKFGVFLFGISLLLWNCNQEENFQLNENNALSKEVQEIKSKFSLDNFKNNSLKNNLVINWSDYVKSTDNLEKLKYEFSTSFKTQVTFNKGEKRIYMVYNLLATKNESNQWRLELIKFIPNNTNKILDLKTTDLSTFSGTLNQYNLKGELTKTIRIEEGKQKNVFIPSDVPYPSVPIGNGCHRISIPTYHWTDWYWKNENGIYVYTGSSSVTVTYEVIWICDENDNDELGLGGGDNFPSEEDLHIHFHGSGGENDTTDNHPEEIIIDSTFSKINKINCTYKQLIKTTTMKELLLDFFGEDAKYDLTFEVVDNLNCNNDDDVYGCTKSNYNPNNNKVLIQIDKDYVLDPETPTLFIAETILHEAIHANLYLAVKKLRGGSLPTSSAFEDLYEQYRIKKNWHHEFMSEHYINVISKGLEEVHPFLGDSNFINDKNQYYTSNDWDAFYKEIAWRGLLKTPKGIEHKNNPNYQRDANLYINSTKINSTKSPKCN